MSLKIKDAFPEIVSRKLPRLQPSATTRDAISLLKSSKLNAVCIEPQTEHSREEGRRRPLAVSKYSILTSLSNTQPSHYEQFMDSSCTDSALLIGSASENDDIVSLLHVFESSTLGYSAIESSLHKMMSMISIIDVLELYEKRIFTSDLFIADVATTPIFGLPPETSLRKALNAMVTRKFRRILIEGTKKIVSDSDIMDFLFEVEPKTVKFVSSRLLDSNLADLHGREPPAIRPTEPIATAAKIASTAHQNCLLTDSSIITPWDIVLKPWRLGRLRIAD
ncbi:MAG: CBS domain-containing protein [Nitrososphaerota archaeon]|nr:CBS domain-containing protein [Nitrososphaerota archaeon]MDG7001849.1 CBS domain-containing protein [Nitrososphaerota archaeon]